jgi:hypothetical protein
MCRHSPAAFFVTIVFRKPAIGRSIVHVGLRLWLIRPTKPASLVMVTVFPRAESRGVTDILSSMPDYACG